MSTSERRDGAPGPLRPRRPEDFDVIYRGKPAWDIGRPQPAFLELADSGVVTGQVLDVGCGTGEHALMAAAAGCEAVGVDMAAAAIAIAERKARDRGLRARFVVMNALELGTLNQTFDTVLDCGLFHGFDDADRAAYPSSLASVIPSGGHYYMLCFSDQQRGTGAHGASPETRSWRRSLTVGASSRSNPPHWTSPSALTAHADGSQASPRSEPCQGPRHGCA